MAGTTIKGAHMKVYVVVKSEHICADESEVIDGGYVAVYAKKEEAVKYASKFGYHVEEEVVQ